jgi:F-type H+-transporting ATPase subunit delta
MKVSPKQYAQTLFDLTDGKAQQEVSDTVKKFAEILKRDGQMKNAKQIMEKFSEIYDAAHGIVNAQVITKEKISLDTKKKVENFIKEKYSAREIVVENVVDEKIKGGIIIKVGDEVLDGSIERQLKSLKNILI